ncbi:MAG: DUF721 domain-containing protein [Bryobacteraceae bacterium]|nr:DUF721 domain-containing protein [Bryobacteraceae bacterium]
MERAGRILARWKASGGRFGAEEMAAAAWRLAAGAKIAEHTTSVTLVRRHLVVELEDPEWRRQLWPLRHALLRNLAKALDEGVVEDIEFRVASLRKKPGREERPARRPPAMAAGGDEAESIADPVLRMLYKTSRRKESA